MAPQMRGSPEKALSQSPEGAAAYIGRSQLGAPCFDAH
jgi:hypothetical protein